MAMAIPRALNMAKRNLEGRGKGGLKNLVDVLRFLIFERHRNYHSLRTTFGT
jgi:hypothetical protein